jgi:hypothetical protein
MHLRLLTPSSQPFDPYNRARPQWAIGEGVVSAQPSEPSRSALLSLRLRSRDIEGDRMTTGNKLFIATVLGIVGLFVALTILVMII